MKNILESPLFYRLFYNIVGGGKAHALFVSDYLKPRNGDRILDIGCGPADILKFLPGVTYTGFDINKRYIETAKKSYSGKGNFFCSNINIDIIKTLPPFDLIIANGVLHHLNDHDALGLFKLASIGLKQYGRILTIDGCYAENQRHAIRFILSKDRGKFVRTRKEYLHLASKVFSNIKTELRDDLLNIPYNHLIVECTK